MSEEEFKLKILVLYCNFEGEFLVYYFLRGNS